MDQPLPFPRTELVLRTDAALDELDRLHAAWAAGGTPSAVELAAIADDLAELRDLAAFAAVVDAFRAPAFAPVV